MRSLRAARSRSPATTARPATSPRGSRAGLPPAPSCAGRAPTWVPDGAFGSARGGVVPPAAAVSGLEFDAVVIPDLSPAFYPASPELARALYVAATRARDWLWLLTPDTWSPLVART